MRPLPKSTHARTNAASMRLILTPHADWSDCYDGGSGCSTPACADAYGNFGAAAMAHFPGAIQECQNEPQGYVIALS